MTEDALGATLFPDYPKIPGWYAREVEGLTDAQLDFTDERVEWMKWGVRRQLSHAAFVHFHWLVNQWAPQVFGPDDEMPDFDAEACASRDRRFDEETHRTPDRLLFRMEEGVSLVRLILGRETIREMRRKELDRVVEPGARYPSGDSVLDFWRVAERINPDIRVDPKNENRFLINLVGMMRQMYLECLIHLYTIQRFKPDAVVVTGDPASTKFENFHGSHPDHRALSEAAYDAVYPAVGNRFYFPDLLESGLDPHKIKEVLFSGSSKSDYYVDIGETFDLKMKVLRCHKSQVSGADDLEERMRDWGRRIGEPEGMAIAESFRRMEHPDGTGK